MNGNEKVLIVDDEYIIAIDIKQRLEALGYEVTGIVNSGEKAISLCEQHKPSVVLMDIIIKGEMDGIETSDIIRDKYNIPVVFITASSDTLTLRKIMTKGSFGYIHKPITDVDLKYTLKQSIKMYHTFSELEKSKNTAGILAETIKESVSQFSFPAFIIDKEENIIRQSAFFNGEKIANINRLINKAELKNEDRIKLVSMIHSDILPMKIEIDNSRICTLIPLGELIYVEIREKQK